MADTPCVIGETIQIRGNLSGSGDLVVRGRIEGFISLQDRLIIEESGSVMATVESRDVTVNGTVNGDIDAVDTVSLNSSATMIGDIRAPQIEIQDGARFRGRLAMDVPLPEGI